MNLLSKSVLAVRLLLKQRIVAFSGSQNGAIAIMFAFLLVPMIGAVGIAIDYSRLLNLRSVAQTAADGAALLAVNVAKGELAKAGDGSSVKESKILAKAKSRGQEFFDSYADNLSEGSARSTITVQRDRQRITARVAYTVNLKTTLTKIFGYGTMHGTSDSGTVASLPLHYDIHLLLDISQSMGLGATEQDMKDLFVATRDNPASGHKACAFACHVPQFGQTVSNESIAKANNITLRVDVLRDAVRNLVTQAKAAMGVDGYYRVSLNTFGKSLTKLADLTNDMDRVSAKTYNIGLGPNQAPGHSDSYHDRMFRASNRLILRDSGDGLSQASAKQFVFIITDGVQNTVGGGPGCVAGHCTSPVSPSVCKAFKDRGATVGVIYTEYLPIKANPLNANSGLYHDYIKLVQPMAPRIEPNLMECASEGWFFKAAYESDILAALNKLFSQISRPPTLMY